MAIDTPETLKTQIGEQLILIDTSDNDTAVHIIPCAVRAGDHLILKAHAGMDLSGIIASLLKNNISVNTVTVRESTLEDVFLTLTGRNIYE